MFPLIACKPSFPPYLQALNPTDQIFDFEELEYYYQVANRKEDPSETKDGDDDDDDEDGEGGNGSKKEDDGKDSESASPVKGEGSNGANGNGAEGKMGPPTVTVSTASGTITTAQINLTNNSPTIDNPYLRAATIPRKVKSESGSSMY